MTGSARQATNGGHITGAWVRAADLPTAKRISRGYDRKAVDTFLLQCANAVDRLNGLLIGAENEIDQLTGRAPRSSRVRMTGRVMTTSGSVKRPVSTSARPRRRRIRAAGRTVSARP